MSALKIKKTDLGSLKANAKRSSGQSETAEQVLDVLTSAFAFLRTDCKKQNKGSGLSVVLFRTLALLWEGPMTNRDLSLEVGLSVAAMSRSVQTLIEKDLIKRKENPSDRRESFLELTTAGESLFRKFRNNICISLDDRLASLSKADLEKLMHGLLILKDSVLS